MFAVVITGPPGAGKTTVLTALVDALSDDDIAHAAVEGETVVWTHPALTDEQWAWHIRLARELYRDAGHRLLLVAQTLEPTPTSPSCWRRSARELAATMPGLAGVDLVLSTEGERAEDVAVRIRAARPDWLS